MRLIINTLICLLVCSWGLTAQGIKFLSSLGEAHQIAKEEGKMIFIDFTAEWCRPCRIMESKVFTDSEVASFYNEHFVNVKLMHKSNKNTFSKYNIDGFPTLMFLDQNGHELDRFLGGRKVDQFLDIGEKIVGISVKDNDRAEKYEKAFNMVAGMKNYRLINGKLGQIQTALDLPDFKKLLGDLSMLGGVHSEVILKEWGAHILTESVKEIVPTLADEQKHDRRIRDQIAFNYFLNGEFPSVQKVAEVVKEFDYLDETEKREVKSLLAAFLSFEIELGQSSEFEKKITFGKSLLTNYCDCSDLNLLKNVTEFLYINYDDPAYYAEVEKVIGMPTGGEIIDILKLDILSVACKKQGKEEASLECLKKLESFLEKYPDLLIPTLLASAEKK